MPGLLNSCWLLLGLCAVVHYLRDNAQCSPAVRLQRGLALGCALALLFPIISADDDWLLQQVACETNACSKLSKASADPNKYTSHAAAAIAAVFINPQFVTVHASGYFTPPRYCSLRSHTAGGRSPPQV